MSSASRLHSESSSPLETRVLTAYRTDVRDVYPEIVPATADRDWMERTGSGGGGWANRCLPLRIANQNGWFILNDADFEVVWGGKNDIGNLRISYANSPPTLAESMFGYGILTFVLPYVFRTPPGFNLLARGPANLWKDGAAPLEGIIETDWLPYSFTMNWAVTRRLKRIEFKKGEPICMIVPVRRYETESFSPEIRNIEANAELKAAYAAWHNARLQAVERAGMVHGHEVVKQQGHYIRGEDHGGARAASHQVKLQVKNFEDLDPLPPRPASAAPPDPRPGLLKRLFGRHEP